MKPERKLIILLALIPFLAAEETNIQFQLTLKQDGKTAAFSDTKHPIKNFQYILDYPTAGRDFNLHAWRGILYSNKVNYRFQEEKKKEILNNYLKKLEKNTNK